MSRWNALLAGALLLSVTGIVGAAEAEAPEFVIVIKNHRFTPTEVTVSAGKKVKFVVDN